MHRLINALILLLVGCLMPSSASVALVPETPVAIVIGSDKSSNKHHVARGKLKLIYLRKQRYWPQGVPIKPVNLQSSHPLRQHFSQVILGSAPNSQIQYWNGQYFNGILPPYVVNSQEAVIRYVAKTKGAIGYVDACHLDKRVKAVAWIINQSIQTSAPENLNCQ